MLVLMGKSGSGKTSIESNMIERYGFVRAISHTTRQKRENDVDGVNYFFVSKEEMERLQNENQLAERIDYLGNTYALCKEQCKTDRIVVVAPEGLKQLVAKDDLDIFSVFLDVNREVRLERMLNRGDSQEDAEFRINNDDAIFDGSESMVSVVLDNSYKSVDEVTEEVYKLYQDYSKGRK
jgi:guanylate kinase